MIQGESESGWSQVNPIDAQDPLGRARGNEGIEARAHLELGLAQRKSGQAGLALESFSQALALEPALVEARFHRALLLQESGRFQEAIADYDQVVMLLPSSAAAHMNRGLALKQCGQLAACRTWGVESENQPQRGQFLPAHSSAMGQKDGEKWGAAADLQPTTPKSDRLLEAALCSLERAIDLAPDWAEAHLNLGLLLKHLQRLEPAVESYRRAIAIEPLYAEAYSNLGVAQKEMGQIDQAIPSFLRAIELKPSLGGPYWNLALAFLMRGQMNLGWQFYESRWKEGCTGVPPRALDRPLWLGAEPIAGKTLLLHCEQGLGDTIQFSRYATLVAKLGARVVLEVQQPLVALLRGLEGIDQIITKGEALPAFDFHCPLLSLPLAFKTDLDTIPASRSYLSVDSGQRRKWEALLGEKKGLRIGLMWSGNPSNSEDYKRSLPLSRLMAGLPRGPQYISLQKDLRDTDKAALADADAPIHYGPQLEDFTDAAALCDLMDLVIGVDTSIAHLGGALGKPTWLMLPSVPDWRWMLNRDDSPWYPSVKLYRQPSAADWEGVFEQIRRDMHQLYGVD